MPRATASTSGGSRSHRAEVQPFHDGGLADDLESAARQFAVAPQREFRDAAPNVQKVGEANDLVVRQIAFHQGQHFEILVVVVLLQNAVGDHRVVAAGVFVFLVVQVLLLEFPAAAHHQWPLVVMVVVVPGARSGCCDDDERTDLGLQHQCPFFWRQHGDGLQIQRDQTLLALQQIVQDANRHPVVEDEFEVPEARRVLGDRAQQFDQGIAVRVTPANGDAVEGVVLLEGLFQGNDVAFALQKIGVRPAEFEVDNLVSPEAADQVIEGCRFFFQAPALRLGRAVAKEDRRNHCRSYCG